MRRNRAPMAVLEPPAGHRQDIAAGIVWGAFLDRNIDRFRRTMDVPVGRRLGCGLFGCVFESSPPWVVKFTRDPTEGPVWAYMAELLTDPEISAELNAFLRVRDIVRIRPDVVFSGEEMPVFGIVREEALPVIRDPNRITDETFRRVRVTTEMLERAGIDPQEASLGDVASSIRKFPEPAIGGLHELFTVLIALRDYRKHALVFADWRYSLMLHDYRGLSQEEAEEISDEAFRGMLEAIEGMRGQGFVNRFGDDMGRTLLAAVQFADLVFQDLHLLNVGWRIHTNIDGDVRPSVMVILDPGAMETPYKPDIKETELVENAVRYLANRRRR